MEQAEAAEKAIESAQAAKDLPVIKAEVDSPAKEVKPPVVDQSKAVPSARPLDGADLQAELSRERQLRKTLEGRLKSQLIPANEEVRRLRKELNESLENVSQLENQNKPSGAERYLNDDERADLGDVLDINARMVKGVLEEELGAGRIKDVVESIMQQNASTKVSDNGPSKDFWSIVDQYCPGASELNSKADRKWVEYLELFNQTTGEKNRASAEYAFDNDDPIALADLFVDFMRVNGTVKREKQDVDPTQRPAPKPESAGQGRRIETQPGAAPSWTEAEVRSFYTDVSKGKFKGRETEAAKLEAEIMAAATVGNIT